MDKYKMDGYIFKRSLILVIFFAALSGMPLAAQNTENGAEGVKADIIEIDGNYRGYSLGMTPDECIDLLKEDSYFDYDDFKEPSLMERSEETLLDCPGRNYIKRGWFQFNSDKLIVITVVLNEKKIDYFSFYKYLNNKYGRPDYLDPDEAIWLNDDEDIEMILSKPLTVKYRDKGYLDGLVQEEQRLESANEKLRENFLKGF